MSSHDLSSDAVEDLRLLIYAQLANDGRVATSGSR